MMMTQSRQEEVCHDNEPCYALRYIKEIIETRLKAQDKALDLANEVLNVRLDGLNHTRELVKDIGSRTVGREEYAIAHRQLETNVQRIDNIQITNMARAEGKASMNAFYLLLLLNIASLLLGLGNLLTHMPGK